MAGEQPTKRSYCSLVIPTGGGLEMPWYEHRGLWVDVAVDGAATATVRLAGECDLVSAEAARAAVAQLPAATAQIIVDLRHVSFIDAAGIGSLIAARKTAAAAGRDLVVRHPSRAVRRLLELTQTAFAHDGGLLGPPGFAPDVIAICAQVTGRAIRYSGAQRGNVQLFDQASGALRIAAQQGFEQPFLDFFEVVDDAESTCGTAMIERRLTWVADVARSPIFTGTPGRDVMLEAGALACVSVPVLHRDGSVIAMLSAHYGQPTAWDGDHERQLRSLAAAAGHLLSAAA